jgi:hypothetical protein
MSQAISYNGWPASKEVESIRIKSYAIKGSHVKLRCAYFAAPLLVAFAEQFNELIEPIDAGNDDWGYCYREVRQVPGKLSNHASGSAIDLNSSKHILGNAGTFPAEKVPMIQALAKKYGLAWGGDYHNRKDEMHFELALDPVKAAKLIEKLGLQYE